MVIDGLFTHNQLSGKLSPGVEVQKLSIAEGHSCEELKDIDASLILGSREKLKKKTLCVNLVM